MTETTKLTAEAHARIKAEIERLEGEGRREIAARIKTAREWGDLKENAEYHAAKDEQGFLETRIQVIERQIRTAKVVEATSDKVSVGS